MKFKINGKYLLLREGEYLSIGYDAENLFAYLIKNNKEKVLTCYPIRRLKDTKMAWELSKSIYSAKENNVSLFDIEAWIAEYENS